MEGLFGKNWYREPIGAPTRSAIAHIVAASYPTAAITCAVASRSSKTRRSPRACCGVRRGSSVKCESRLIFGYHTRVVQAWSIYGADHGIVRSALCHRRQISEPSIVREALYTLAVQKVNRICACSIRCRSLFPAIDPNVVAAVPSRFKLGALGSG